MASNLSTPRSTDTDSGHRTPSRIISADKVHDTEVFNCADEKLGTIDSILIDKYTGEVSFVIMSFGGFLGIGEKFHPLPWRVLDYDTGIDGYRVDLSRAELEKAPIYDREAINAYDYDADDAGLNSYYAGKIRKPAGSGLGTDDTGRNHGFFSPEQQSDRNTPNRQRSDAVAATDQSNIDELVYKRDAANR